MSGIIGPVHTIHSAVRPLEAHISHLRHLTNNRIVVNLLTERFALQRHQARDVARQFCAHVSQGLEFFEASRKSSLRIRPVLQYYCFLNLSVAAILAYRPSNHNQYRTHGVQDRTRTLRRLKLSSQVLATSNGAVPLFHSIISDVPLSGKTFQLGQISAGIHMLSHELLTEFSKDIQKTLVGNRIIKNGGEYRSEMSFQSYLNQDEHQVSPIRLETAMPLLKTRYRRDSSSTNPRIYHSIQSWPDEQQADEGCRADCIKLINYGGHGDTSNSTTPRVRYLWHGIPNITLLPTLTSVLLFAFTLASLVRYRPALLESALSSKEKLLVDTFVQEADAIFIPSLRNLLRREEVYISQVSSL